MAGASDPNRTREFLATAQSEQLLSPEAARRLSEQAAASGSSAAALALEAGALDVVEVDIVETLLAGSEAIPGYDVVRVLGRGGMGVVFEARQKNLDRAVAVKTILVSQLGHSKAVQRFEQEARAVARLSHPNIVAAHDFGRHGGRVYLVMELLQGETLEEHLATRERLDEATTWAILRQAASGLDHAARAGIVHRDVKPGNLFLVEAPVGVGLPPGVPMVKLTDFGLAKLSDSAEVRLTATGTAMGTPLYMAPEAITGAATVDHRGDLYALGVTAFVLLAGRPPFTGQGPLEILMAKNQAEAPSLREVAPTVSEATAALVADLLRRRPDQRLGSYAELLERIDALLGPTWFSATPTSPRPAAPTATAETLVFLRTRLRRVGWRGAALAVGAALVLAVGLYLAGRPAPTVPEVEYVSGFSQPLFDGKTLEGWRTLSKVWAPAANEERAMVIEGRGVLARRLPPLASYRVLVAIDLHRAETAEVHFGLRRDAGQARLLVRVTATEVQLLAASGDDAPTEPRSPPFPVRRPGPEDDELPSVRLEVERRGPNWHVRVGGKPLGSAPASPADELAELRLVASGPGPARFADLELIELVPEEP